MYDHDVVSWWYRLQKDIADIIYLRGEEGRCILYAPLFAIALAEQLLGCVVEIYRYAFKGVYGLSCVSAGDDAQQHGFSFARAREMQREVDLSGLVLARPACAWQVIAQDGLRLLDDKSGKDTAYGNRESKGGSGIEVKACLFASYLFDFFGTQRAVQQVRGDTDALFFWQAA